MGPHHIHLVTNTDIMLNSLRSTSQVSSVDSVRLSDQSGTVVVRLQCRRSGYLGPVPHFSNLGVVAEYTQLPLRVCAMISVIPFLFLILSFLLTHVHFHSFSQRTFVAVPSRSLGLDNIALPC